MRNSTAYFAGVATVFTAVALGFGGAMVVTNATAPQSSPEPTKLQRQAAAAVQASPSTGANPPAVATSAAMQGSTQAPPPQAPAQNTPSPSLPDQTTSQQATTTAVPTTPPSEPSAAVSPATSAADAYARVSDKDLKKYIHKRDRRWVRRHNRDDGATTDEQASVDQTSYSSIDPSKVPPGASNQTALQGQPSQAQIKTADQSSNKTNGIDTASAGRKHNRRWTRGYVRNYARDDDGQILTEDRTRATDVRETPRNDAPQPFFGMPRWRPLFSEDHD